MPGQHNHTMPAYLSCGTCLVKRRLFRSSLALCLNIRRAVACGVLTTASNIRIQHPHPTSTTERKCACGRSVGNVHTRPRTPVRTHNWDASYSPRHWRLLRSSSPRCQPSFRQALRSSEPSAPAYRESWLRNLALGSTRPAPLEGLLAQISQDYHALD